jgi:hypothetical protein
VDIEVSPAVEGAEVFYDASPADEGGAGIVEEGGWAGEVDFRVGEGGYVHCRKFGDLEK